MKPITRNLLIAGVVLAAGYVLIKRRYPGPTTRSVLGDVFTDPASRNSYLPDWDYRRFEPSYNLSLAPTLAPTYENPLDPGLGAGLRTTQPYSAGTLNWNVPS